MGDILFGFGLGHEWGGVDLTPSWITPHHGSRLTVRAQIWENCASLPLANIPFPPFLTHVH